MCLIRTYFFNLKKGSVNYFSKSIHILLDTFSINLTRKWIPVHTSIFGNEVADQLVI